MGTWGTGSFDDDGAADFTDDFLNVKKIHKLLDKKKLEQYEYGNVRACAALFLNLNKAYDFNSLYPCWSEKLVSKLEIILDDEDWMNDWSCECNAIIAKKEIKKQIKQLNKYINI